MRGPPYRFEEAGGKESLPALPQAFIKRTYDPLMEEDALLQQAIIDELAEDGNLDRATIAVSVKDGVVHVTGTVPTAADLREVCEKTRMVPGVRRVYESLQVARELI